MEDEHKVPFDAASPVGAQSGGRGRVTAVSVDVLFGPTKRSPGQWFSRGNAHQRRKAKRSLRRRAERALEELRKAYAEGEGDGHE